MERHYQSQNLNSTSVINIHTHIMCLIVQSLYACVNISKCGKLWHVTRLEGQKMDNTDHHLIEK